MPGRYLDISDVVEYFGYQLAASGIQRVQLEFIRHLADAPDGRHSFVMDAQDSSGFRVVDSALLLDLVRGIDSGALDRPAMDKLLAAIIASRRQITPGPGDLFFVSGAFWAPATIVKSLINAKLQGAKVGFLCYDLIAVRHPEYCDAGLATVFGGALETICHVTDFIFTISEYVKKDVEAYLADLDIDVPVTALPLAHELAPLKGSGEIGERVRAVIERPYALFVSTIEARKNHLYTLLVWQRLLKTMPDKVPDLVWVGRPGWLVKDMMARLERLKFLDGKVRILSGLTDAELAALYTHCRFTIYPSLAEGWGLPVAESLIAGKPAVVSTADSLPEVGGDFVFYIDPLNVSDGVRTVGRLLSNPAELDKAEQRIKRSFKPRLWRDVARDLARGLDRMEALGEIKRDAPVMVYKPGALYHAGIEGRVEGDTLSRRQRPALEAVFDGNWFSSEPWGRWMRGIAGGVWLETGREGRHVVHLRFNTFEHWKGRRAAVHCPETGQEAIFPVAPGRQYDVLVTMILPAGRTRLVLRTDRGDAGPGADRRQLSLGLAAFGFAEVDDTEALAALKGRVTNPGAIAVTAGAQGPDSGLAPLDAAATPGWRRSLVGRTLREGPRAFAIRVLRRMSYMLAGDRI